MRRVRVLVAVGGLGMLASACLTAPTPGHRRHLTMHPPPATAPAPPASEIERTVAGKSLQAGHIYRGTLPPPDITPRPPAQVGATAAPAMPAMAPAARQVAEGAAVPPALQYLYGSGEAAALSTQAWRGLVGYVAGKVLARPADSVVLAPGATLAAPRFVSCDDKPLAAIFDVDETVLLNIGAEYDGWRHGGPFDRSRWEAYERSGIGKSEAVPGAASALAALRTMRVAVIFNSNRDAAFAAQSGAAIEAAGLGEAKHGETLFLMGDDVTGAHKDARRARIAARYCVVAMGGDQLGDFSDLFNAGLSPMPRRAATLAAPVARLWGAGWFVMPNPAYGPAMSGGVDDIFPVDRRWSAEGRP